MCNYADQVVCNNKITTSTASGFVVCDQKLDLTPVENCSKFYKCLDNNLYVFNCPFGYLFNSNLRECQLANQVNCVSTNLKTKKRRKKKSSKRPLRNNKNNKTTTTTITYYIY